MMLNNPNQTEIRAKFEELVLKDLLGPANGPEEEINETWVSSRYLVGWLAPKDVGRGGEAAKARAAAVRSPDTAPLVDDNPLNPIEDETSLGAGSDESSEEGFDDDPIIGTESMLPNSFGMTFCVAPGVDTLRVQVSWGWYQRRKSETGFVTKKGEPKMVWFRTPVQGETLLSIKDDEIGPWIPFEETPLVYVKGQVRSEADGTHMVTLFLVNDQDGKDGKDDKWLFQTQLAVESADCTSCFVRRPVSFNDDPLDELERVENEQMRMNYRHRAEIAVGHGISVDWKLGDSPLCSWRIWTTPVPAYEVPKARPNQMDGVDLRMKSLSLMSQNALKEALQPIVDQYRVWIGKQSVRIHDSAERLAEFDSAFKFTISKAIRAADRIEEGIHLLSKDSTAYEAFCFMNEAMHGQRLHSLLSQAIRKGNQTTLADIEAQESPSWYPFQLAFILVNLPSLASLQHRERCGDEAQDPCAELLWFPTGGGKTEAYLGLTSFTLAIRRLQGEIAGRDGLNGVAVLMRYTLRLLTLQQFQRATTLICACELIRRADPKKWGHTPFRIGLWVGQASTPNTYDQAQSALDDTRRGDDRRSAKGSLQQLTNCPWCGTQIEVGRHLIPDVERRRLITYCGDPLGRCPFSKKKAEWEGLPICIVDEEIYRLLPCLVIATVDKFAQMPWQGETGMLFGNVTQHCPRHGFLNPSSKHQEQSHIKTERHERALVVEASPLRPPDLIIQDEIHLITGPLGSLVGIYETAIDSLCSWTVDGKRVRPKIVVSTATIRKATDQVNALFARNLEVFPPRGIDSEDNFFAVQHQVSDSNPGLRYVGICGSGRRLKVALIRVYVACLCAGQTLYEKYGKDADPYLTLIGYFSSIRELGGMRRLLDDDVRSRIQQMDKRGLSKRSFKGGYDELTSRRTAGDIPRMLDRMEADFDPEKEAKRDHERKQRQKLTTQTPFDTVIATNMISVGVDVPRLGLMIVAGQPKLTAEYVQATARVGRRYPGLVFTVHNWARARDLSHFETFNHFHATIHANVEAPSVTPFAAGARDRATAGVLASLVRLSNTFLNADEGAGEVKSRNAEAIQAINTFKERATQVISPIEGEAVERECSALIDYWISEANRPHRTLVYKEPKDFAKPLLRHPDDGPWDRFTCLNSLREVEQSSNLVLIDLPDASTTVEHEDDAQGEEESL